MIERIVILMGRHGVNGVQLGKMLGLEKSPVTDWKNGKSKPTLDQIVMICDIFEVSSDFLLFGKEHPYPHIDGKNYIVPENSSQTAAYRRSGFTIKDDIIFARFKEAREAAGISIEDAAAGSYLKVEEIINLEKNSESDTAEDMLHQMKKLKEIDLVQFASLAYLYGVDLYWLFYGSVRVPAAVVKNGVLMYPPYEFMIEQLKQQTGDEFQEQLSVGGETSEEQQLLLLYQALDNKGRSFVMTLIKDYVESHTNLSYSPKTAGTGGGNIA